MPFLGGQRRYALRAAHEAGWNVPSQSGETCWLPVERHILRHWWKKNDCRKDATKEKWKEGGLRGTSLLGAKNSKMKKVT